MLKSTGRFMSIFSKTYSALITPRGDASLKAESSVYSYSYSWQVYRIIPSYKSAQLINEFVNSIKSSGKN